MLWACSSEQVSAVLELIFYWGEQIVTSKEIIYKHIHVCTYTHMYKYTYTHVYAYKRHSHICTCTHTHIYTEIIMDDVKKNKVRGLREVRGRKTDASD